LKTIEDPFMLQVQDSSLQQLLLQASKYQGIITVCRNHHPHAFHTQSLWKIFRSLAAISKTACDKNVARLGMVGLQGSVPGCLFFLFCQRLTGLHGCGEGHKDEMRE